MNWFEFDLLDSTEDLLENVSIELYPNPSNGIISLQADLGEQEAIEISIMNLLGQKVYAQKVYNQRNIEESIDLKNIPAGNYFINIHLDNGAVFTKKLVRVEE